MTLNLTALTPEFVVQVSDRRLTSVSSSGSRQVDDDDANKAVILSCSDSLLAVTFTGLGRLRNIRVDEWLLDVLQKEALCEMAADAAVAEFAKLATKWFRSFRSLWSGAHTFVLAGFQKRPSSGHPRAQVWFVTNTVSADHSYFGVQLNRGARVFVTGFLPAFTRNERRRIQAAARKIKNFIEVEDLMVSAIRNAASSPNGGAIGMSCMSVALMPHRVAVTRFHPLGEHPHNFAPHAVWYEGGRNFVVKGVDHLSGGRYSLVFGGDACQFTVRPVPGPGRPPTDTVISSFDLRFTNAKYHTDPVTDAGLIKIVSDPA